MLKLFATFLLCIYATNGLFLVHPLVYQDCNNSPNKLLHVVENSVHLSPYPVQVPGSLDGGVSLQILKPISGHDFALHVHIQKKLLGRYQTVPCVSHVGSCTYDVCDLIGEGSNDTCADYLKKSNFPCHCPLPSGTFTLQPTTFHISEATGLYSWVASGEYAVDVKIENKVTKEEVGCYHVEVELQSKTSGFLFG